MIAEVWEWISLLKWWAPKKQIEKNLELLWIGENNSHNRKQLWEDGIKLEPHISERTDEDLEEKLFFGLQNQRITTRNTTMNCWDTPGWKIRKVEPMMKIIWPILEKDIWLMIIHSYVKLRKTLGMAPGKLEESGKILGKDLWVRAHSKDTPFK